MNAPPDRGRVLIVGGSAAWAGTLADALSADGHRVLRLEADAEASDSARVKNPDAVILACGAAAPAERAVMTRLREARPDMQIVLAADAASHDQALACAKAGLADFVEIQGGPIGSLLLTTRRAVERRWLQVRLGQLDAAPGNASGVEGLVGSSNAMRENLRRVEELARANTNVLIEGEPGTGRGTMSRVMHLAGPRREEPFIRLRCIEIGGSGQSPKGSTSIEEAFAGVGRGTIFLEAIDALKGPAQRELLARLEALEQALLQGPGTRSEQPRLIASASSDLDLQVQRGQFEGELYRRLKGESLRLPPLRERREEIPALVSHFLRRLESDGESVKGMDGAALNLLCRYDWPGNLREVEDCLRYAMAVAGGASIRPDDLPEKIVESSRQQAAGQAAGALSLKGYEKHTIEQALSLCDGDVVATAAMLGIGRSTLYRKMKSHGVQRRSFRRSRKAGA